MYVSEMTASVLEWPLACFPVSAMPGGRSMLRGVLTSRLSGVSIDVAAGSFGSLCGVAPDMLFFVLAMPGGDPLFSRN